MYNFDSTIKLNVTLPVRMVKRACIELENNLQYSIGSCLYIDVMCLSSIGDLSMQLKSLPTIRTVTCNVLRQLLIGLYTIQKP